VGAGTADPSRVAIRARRRAGVLVLVALGAVAVPAWAVLRKPSHGATATADGSRGVSSAASSVPRVTPLTKVSEPHAVAPGKPVPLFRPFSGHRPLRVLVVGDSVGASFARGMSLWAKAHGNTEVLDASRMWCALGRTLPISHGIGVQMPGSGCDDWGTRWAADINQFDPDVVLVHYTVWEIAPRRLPGHTDLLQPGVPALDAWQLSEYQAAVDVLSARGAKVVWFTIPCENELIQPGWPMWYVNRRTIPKLAASRPAVTVIDLDHELCAHGASHDYAGVHDARPDGVHYSDAGALAVAEWVMPIVRGQVPNPKPVAETDPTPAASVTRTTG
jgi:SGNH domain (fused to AT3 domains)